MTAALARPGPEARTVDRSAQVLREEGVRTGRTLFRVLGALGMTINGGVPWEHSKAEDERADFEVATEQIPGKVRESDSGLRARACRRSPRHGRALASEPSLVSMLSRRLAGF